MRVVWDHGQAPSLLGSMLDLGSGLCCAAGHIAHMYASAPGPCCVQMRDLAEFLSLFSYFTPL
jgi:hypothetical protein